MRIRTQLALAASMATAIPPVLAADERAESIETIVVTATRTPIALHEALVPVTVIDRDNIERSGAQDLSELLRFQAGLDVVRTGGPGQQTSVFTRGTNSDHTLVLVDGVRINSGSIGIAAVEHIAPEMIERVEIVRGPRTSLYGEDAIGGVVNVITRRPAGGDVAVTGGYGSNDTRQASLAAGADWNGIEGGLTVSSLVTDGFPVVEGGAGDQGYDNLTINAFTATDIGYVRAEARLWQSQGATDYLTQDCSAFPLCADVPVDQDYLNRSVALRLTARPGDAWQSALEGSLITDDIDQNQSAEFAHTDRQVLDWQNTINVSAGHVVVAGAYMSDEDVEVASAWALPLVPDDTTIMAVYAEDSFSAGPHQLGLAARYSDHDVYGEDLTWNVEYGFALQPGLRLIGTAGRALRAPNATELYGSFGGNDRLQPEDSLTFSAGMQWDLAIGHRLGVSAYRIRIDDLIDYDPESVFPDFQLKNVEAAKIHGVETSWDFTGGAWQWRMAATLQDPEDETTGDTLLRRAKLSFSTSLARSFGPHQLGLDALLVGPRDDFAGELAGYGLVNLTGLYAAADRIKVQLRVENLLDRDYAPAFYDFSRRYTAPGRGLYAELRYDLR